MRTIHPHQVNLHADGFRTVVKPDWFDRCALAGLWAMLVIALLVTLFGCQPAAVRQSIADAQAKQAIKDQQAKNQAQDVKNKALVDDAKAKASPVTHPVASANQAVKHYRSAALTVSELAGLTFCVAVGLAFTPLSVISKIAIPVSGFVAALSFAGVIVLPYLPWIIYAGLVAAVGLGIYEVIRYKSVSAAVSALKTDVSHLNLGSVVSSVTSAVSFAESEAEKVATQLKAGTASAPIAITPTVSTSSTSSQPSK